jgi:hypothetical protein
MSTSMLNNELVVDADSHWSEPADLFTSRAPAKYVDRVPHVELVDGERTWVFDGKAVGRFSAAKMATLPDATRRKIMGENARKLYRL